MSRNVLVLGGTAWVGREIAAQAIARGDDVWCLARGESGDVADGATLVKSDRDDRHAYEEVAQRDWDAVFEVSWQPRHVRLGAEALAGRVGQWTYVSSVSVYESTRQMITEDAPLREPAELDEVVDITRYDNAKVRCELDTVDSHPDALLVRAGVIIGPGDPTERFAYWPRRAAQAGDGPMLVPGGAAHPMQVVDVRDMVAWMLHASSIGMSGPVNVTGESLPFHDAVARVRAAVGATGETVEADPAWLAEHGVGFWKGPDSLPLWVADDGAGARTGFHAHGLYTASGGVVRPFEQSVADVLADERALGLDRAGVAGISRERELELIAELRG